MSCRRRYPSPRLLSPSRRSLPPLERCRGTSPIHAARCRPELKFFALPTAATMAVAITGPTPGTAVRRSQAAPSRVGLDQAAVELRRPPLEIVQVGNQALQQLACERRDASVLNVSDHSQELTQAALPSRGDDPELGQVAAQSVDRGGALLQQLLAHPVQHQHRLLVLALGRDEPHAGALHRLAAGLGIGRIVLVGLDVGPNVLRRHQPHLVPELGQLTSPVAAPQASRPTRQAGKVAKNSSTLLRANLRLSSTRPCADQHHAPETGSWRCRGQQ